MKETTSERNLRLALMEIELLASKLYLPQNVTEAAKTIYKTVVKRDLLIGRTILEFVSASVYAACRQFKIPRTLGEISKVTSIERKHISKTYRLLVKELGLKMPIDDPLKYVPRMASELGVRRETELLAEKILLEAGKRKSVTGKDPLGLAAAAFYLACRAKNEKCSQKDVATAVGVTDLTIRNRMKDLESIIAQIIP